MSFQNVMAAALVLASVTSGEAQARSAGRSVVSVGWADVRSVNGGSTPLTVESFNGVPVNQEIPGATTEPDKGGTVVMNFEHYLTDNVSLFLMGGIPGDLRARGAGSLSKYGELGEAKVISPHLMLRYHFGNHDENFRPFVGLGVNYAKFTNEKITNKQFITDSLGPGGTVKASASSSWNPVVEAGADYWLSDRFTLGLSVSYKPVKTKLTLTGRTASGDETVIKSTLTLDPIVTVFTVGYSF